MFHFLIILSMIMIKKTENMKTKYRKLKDRRKIMSIFIALFLTNHQQSGHVLIFCMQCIFPIAPPHLWMAVCLTCFLRWSIPFTEPAAKAFLRCVTITFLISLVLLEFSLSFLCLSFCLPSSHVLSFSLCFLSPSCSLKPDQLALDGFPSCPCEGLTSHSRPWVFLPEGAGRQKFEG